MKLSLKHVVVFLLMCCFILISFFAKKPWIYNKSGNGVVSTKYSEVRSSTSKDEIAVIDLKRVAVESKAGQSIEKQIADINDIAKKDLQEVESKMKSMEKNKLSESDSRKFEDMQFALYDMVSTKRYQISEAYKKAVSELEAEVNKIVMQISEQNQLQMVISLEAVVCIGGHCRDITEEVIQKVNETLPLIPIVIK